MSVDTTTSLEVLDAEALTPESPCEAGEFTGCHGQNMARWYGLRSCGCPVDTWCDSDMRVAIAWQVAGGGTVHCFPCDVTIVIRFEPIR